MSAVIIKDNIYIEAKLDGEKVEGLDLFEEVLISEHLNMSLPTASVTFNDAEKITLKEMQLTDGIKLDITIGKSADNPPPPATFRLFSDGGSRQFASGQKSTAHFVLDAPKYFGKSARIAKKCNSSDMISEIASQGGLSYDGESTDDEQIWYAVGQTLSNAARQIAANGYMSDNSCMVLAVSTDKKLMYKDINRIMMSSEPKKKLYTSTQVPEDDPEVLLIYADKSRTSSGVMNNWLNYGYLHYSNGYKEEPEEFTTVDSQKPEGKLAISADVKGEVEHSRIDLSHFDIGNIHEKYHRAYYQNLRYRAMFTETTSIIIQDFSGLALLDTVYLSIGSEVSMVADDQMETVKSGKYVVIGITKVIRNGKLYGERLELCRNFIRVLGSNPLVG